MKLPSAKDLELLLSFLSDPNDHTVQLARKQLKELIHRHPECLPLLRETRDPAVAAHAHQFLEETRLETLENDFRNLARQGDHLDLQEGAYLLALWANPGLKSSAISEPLDLLAEELEGILDAEEASLEEEVKLLRKFLFSQHGFHGNRENYYDPDNSFLHSVLERRSGIPISLSIVYLLLAQRVDIDAHGIGLPGHFIVGHAIPGRMLLVDPFGGGKLLTRQDCAELVRRRGLTFRDAFLAPTSNAQILARMIVNLVNVYTEQGKPDSAHWLSKLMAFFQETP